MKNIIEISFKDKNGDIQKITLNSNEEQIKEMFSISDGGEEFNNFLRRILIENKKEEEIDIKNICSIEVT